jgi:hypothetical protein
MGACITVALACEQKKVGPSALKVSMSHLVDTFLVGGRQYGPKY